MLSNTRVVHLATHAIIWQGILMAQVGALAAAAMSLLLVPPIE